jgi:antimicrobial peptide system SdpA family protein
MKHPGRAKPRGAVGAITAVWVVFGFYAAHSAIPTNPVLSMFSEVNVPLGAELQPWMRNFAPEGWAMFTIPPAAPRVTAFRRLDDGRWVETELGSFGEPTNRFGLDRSARARMTEVSALAQMVRSGSWQACSGAIPACLERTSAGPARNPAARPDLCGDIGLVRSAPRGPAWVSAHGSAPAVYVARLLIRC